MHAKDALIILDASVFFVLGRRVTRKRDILIMWSALDGSLSWMDSICTKGQLGQVICYWCFLILGGSRWMYHMQKEWFDYAECFQYLLSSAKVLCTRGMLPSIWPHRVMDIHIISKRCLSNFERFEYVFFWVLGGHTKEAMSLVGSIGRFRCFSSCVNALQTKGQFGRLSHTL